MGRNDSLYFLVFVRFVCSLVLSVSNYVFYATFWLLRIPSMSRTERSSHLYRENRCSAQRYADEVVGPGTSPLGGPRTVSGPAQSRVVGTSLSAESQFTVHLQPRATGTSRPAFAAALYSLGYAPRAHDASRFTQSAQSGFPVSCEYPVVSRGLSSLALR